jgi:UDP-glucose 4-epimerase
MPFCYDRIYDNRQFHPIDLLNVKTLNGIIEYYKPDVVFHFAAYAALGLSPFIRNFNYSNNILASVNVINASVNYGVRKLVFTSSMDVYGEGTPPFKESDQPNPIDPYGIAKYAVELDIKEAHNRFGLEYTIIRPHNVIGIYQNIWDRYRNVIGIWIRQILNNQPITIFGDGSVKRAFSDIKYYMQPMERVINDFNGEVFNVGSDRVYTLLEAANTLIWVAESFGYKSEIKFLEERKEVKEAYVNHDKAKEMLKFNDETDLGKVMTEMFKWAMDQPNREVIQMPYEINKSIYTFWK